MKRIAILAETSLASGRQIVTGIARFLDERNDWSVFQHFGPLGAMDLTAISLWQGDGIIARIANPELLALIQAKGLPTVDVVGVDNDRPFCNLCRPRLSSVEPNHELVGYRAAQTLERLINGEVLEQSVVEIDLHTLHPRLSSELIAIDDPALLKALNYIREHACEGTSLDAIALASGLSRSVLQRRFRVKLNRTVGDVILNEKLRSAREMLKETELPISLIAERSGFNCQEYMNHIFKKHLETTPRKYRLR
ncbi:MAG: AraC-like DNA-binding protein [Lentimonas sp.]|jgi:AraC-like DNA-binding protein